jgi:DNA invertase Pin-like site-specific DNA recombinase
MFPAPAAHKEAYNAAVDAAAYVRVSTRQQSLEAQKDVISRAATARGDTISHWYGEKVSGFQAERAELVALRQAVRRGEHQKCYVFRIDRLSRSGVLATFTVVDELTRNGCSVVTVADAFELGGPVGDIVLAVLAACAQMERIALSDRLAAARERTVMMGGAWGRPKTLKEDTLRLARKMISEGHTLRYTARELGVAKTTLGRALSQKTGEIPRYIQTPEPAETDD